MFPVLFSMWNHVSCFFKRQHPRSVGDIANFENLRFSDQELIKKHLGKFLFVLVWHIYPDRACNYFIIKLLGASAGASATGNGTLSAKEKLAQKNAALKDYVVAYALSGR